MAVICAAALLCLQSKREYALSQPSDFNQHANVIALSFDAGKEPKSLVFEDSRIGTVSSQVTPLGGGAGLHILSRGADPHRDMAEIANSRRSTAGTVELLQ